MAEETNPLEELLVDELKDLYSAESQLIKALPKMAKAAESDELRSAFEKHLEQTKTHAERLEQPSGWNAQEERQQRQQQEGERDPARNREDEVEGASHGNPNPSARSAARPRGPVTRCAKPSAASPFFVARTMASSYRIVGWSRSGRWIASTFPATGRTSVA